MNEQKMFEQLLDQAVRDRSDEMPDKPEEFDLHVDNHYNVYMCIKGEWQSVGLNVTPM